MDTARADALARGGLNWLLHHAHETDAGLAWGMSPSHDGVNYSIYHGTGGVVPALLEGWRHFGDDRYADAALRAAKAMEASLEEMHQESLYIGRAGAAAVLHGVGEVLGDEHATAGSKRALGLVRDKFDGERWGDAFELMLGNAGIGLVALACGDLDMAVLAVEPYVRNVQKTPAGVRWEEWLNSTRQLHKVGHGTLGIALALAVIGAAADREDMVELAIAGAAEVVSRDEQGAPGFLTPHSDPPNPESRQARFSYGWCAGPTGDAVAFRALARATGDPKWTDLVDRCWHTVTTSGLPERLTPGFWDNNGVCCGTAGVLGLAGDVLVERGVGPDFGEVLVADLDMRATVDEHGVCWSNHEYRDEPADLEPRTGWGFGNGGIVRELMRWSRVSTGGDPAYVLPLPDEVPAIRSAV